MKIAASATGLLAALILVLSGSGARATPARTACSGWGRPAVAADLHPHALRVFAIQFRQRPAQMRTAAEYASAVDCAIRTEVLPHLAHGRPNLVVFDEDIGLETIAIGPRGADARAVLRSGSPSCHGVSLCPTLNTLNALGHGYAKPLGYLEARFPRLKAELGQTFVAATDEFVRVFMTTMARAARHYGVYVIASNTQARFRLDRTPAAITALADPGAPRPKAVYAPTSAAAYDQTFVWSPRVLHPSRVAPLANLVADNVKVPLTSFEQQLGFAPGPATGPAARANLRPIPIPGTRARLGLATSLPTFVYGRAAPGQACRNVALTYMRCLNQLGANVVIQADANDGQWSGTSGNEPWQPLAWMGSAYRAVTDPTVGFAYAVNPFMVGNLADIPFDGQSAILARGHRGRGCAYVGDRHFLAGQDQPGFRAGAGLKPQFLAMAPWVVPNASRAHLRSIGASLAAGSPAHHYVQTALVADLPFPSDPNRPGCLVAGR
ncbi:MAG: hypothetical protein ABI323_07760 [Solirubrobacteraceae bacterium]